jgi:hypothetical protein
MRLCNPGRRASVRLERDCGTVAIATVGTSGSSRETARAQMTMSMSPKDIALYRAVDEVLHHVWDPIVIRP